MRRQAIDWKNIFVKDTSDRSASYPKYAKNS